MRMKEQISNDRKAIVLIFFAMFIYALFPLASKISGAENTPFLFNAFNHLSGFIVCTGWLIWRFRSWSLPLADVRKIILFMSFSKQRIYILISALGGTLSLPLFVISLRSIDVSSATVIFEMQHLIFIFLSMFLLRNYPQYRKDAHDRAWLGILALVIMCGAYLVTVGEKGRMNVSFDYSSNFGISIALLAAVCSALPRAFGVKYAKEMGTKLQSDFINILKQEKDTEIDMLSAVFCLAAYYMLSAVACFLVAGFGNSGLPYVQAGESFSWPVLGWGVFIGVLGSGLGGMAFRRANLLTSNLGVNALSYGTPAIAIIFLMITSTANPDKIEYIVMGVAAIIVSNLLLHLAGDVRSAYKITVLCLWAFGTLIFFRGNLFSYVEWTNYFIAIEILSIVFVLVVQFRVDRFSRRISEEENMAISILNKIKTLDNGNKYIECLDDLVSIKSGKDNEILYECYKTIKRKITIDRSVKNTSEKDKVIISELDENLDSFVLSRSQGFNLGEILVIRILSIITIGIVLFSRPDIELGGWEGFFLDVLVISYAITVVFLTADVHDLQNDRIQNVSNIGKYLHGPEDASDMELQYRTLGVDLKDRRNRKTERVISTVICSGIFIAYGWLLWIKWFG